MRHTYELDLQLANRSRDVPDNCLVALALSCVDSCAASLDAQATLERLVRFYCEQSRIRSRNEDLPHLECQYDPIPARAMAETFEGLEDGLHEMAPTLVDLQLLENDPEVGERLRFRDSMLELASLPGCRCHYCGDLCYAQTLSCLHSLFSSSTSLDLDAQSRVRKPWGTVTHGEPLTASQVSSAAVPLSPVDTVSPRDSQRPKSPVACSETAMPDFTVPSWRVACVGCRSRWRCPVFPAHQCGGDFLMFRFSLTQLNVLLALTIDAARSVPGFTLPTTLSKSLSKFPRLTDMVEYYRSSAFALCSFAHNFANTNAAVRDDASEDSYDPSALNESSARADESRMRSLPLAARQKVTLISWTLLAAAIAARRACAPGDIKWHLLSPLLADNPTVERTDDTMGDDISEAGD